jgi:hypothetical protein
LPYSTSCTAFRIVVVPPPYHTTEEHNGLRLSSHDRGSQIELMLAPVDAEVGQFEFVDDQALSLSASGRASALRVAIRYYSSVFSAFQPVAACQLAWHEHTFSG